MKSFKHTKLDAKATLDYIIKLRKDTGTKKIVLEECQVVLPSNKVLDDVELDDWRETSIHYPLLADIEA